VALNEVSMKKFLIVVLVMQFAAGCNTLQGVGKDLKQGGEAIERAVTKK
jgi:predicted small secreted protein